MTYTHRQCILCGTSFGVETTASRRGMCLDCLTNGIVEASKMIEDANQELSWRHGKDQAKNRRGIRKMLRIAEARLERLQKLQAMR